MYHKMAELVKIDLPRRGVVDDLRRTRDKVMHIIICISYTYRFFTNRVRKSGMDLCLTRRFRKIIIPETTIMPRSLKAPKRTDCITSLHPLYPVLKCNSRGHQSETGEDVSTASATTWEIRSRKQNKKFNFGILDQHLQTLDASKAITRANRKL